MTLRPFIRYYGGKWRAAPLYPAPMHRTIVEPFAGAAGYSMRHHRHDVILVEKYAPLAEMWRWLIAALPAEVLSIPCVENIDDLPSWVPAGARALAAMSMANGDCWQRSHTSTGIQRLHAEGKHGISGWSVPCRARVARQVLAIKHWRIIEGDYTDAPDIDATWHIDPPYNNKAGEHYPCGSHKLDFNALAQWCMGRRGQVMVCENVGATWLPFRHLATFHMGVKNKSREAIWTNGPMGQLDLMAAAGS